MSGLWELREHLPLPCCNEEEPDSPLWSAIVARLQETKPDLVSGGEEVKIVQDFDWKYYKPHGQKRIHEELQPSHRNASLYLMLPSLGGMKVVVEKAFHILKEAELGLQEVHPGQQIKNEMTFPVIRFLVHVEIRMWLTAKILGRDAEETVEANQGKPAMIQSICSGLGGGGSFISPLRSWGGLSF